MNKAVLISLIICLNIFAIEAQDVFQRIYNLSSQSFVNLNWYGSIYDNDSGYVFAGSFSDSISGTTLMRLNKDGTIRDATVYGVTPGDLMTTIDVITLPDQTIMHNCYTNSGSSMLIKTDYPGVLYTAKDFSPTFGTTIYKQTLLNGSIYGAGRSRYNNTNGGMLVKLDLEGNPLNSWFIDRDSGTLVTLTGIFPTADNCLIMSGTRVMYGASPPSEMLIIKTDTLGNIIFSKQIGEAGLPLMPSEGGGIEASDRSLLFIISNAGGAPSGILKTDSLGNVLWYKTYSNTITYKPIFYQISRYGSNQFIAMGNIDSTANESRPMYMIFDNNGNVVDAKLFSGSFKMNCSGNFYNPTKGLLMSGFIRDALNNNYSYFVYKTDLNLNSACQSTTVSMIDADRTTTDSTGVIYTSTPYNLTVNDAGALISQTPLVLNDYDLCPALTGINSWSKNDLVKVSPNPSKGVLTIIKNVMNENGSFKIIDVNGKEVKSILISNTETTISIDELKAGFYFYKFSCVEKIFTGKFILN